MVTHTHLPRALLSIALATLLGALPAIAAAEEPLPSEAAKAAKADATSAPAAAEPLEPEVHHAPLTSSFAHEPLRFEAQIDHPELVRSMALVYRGAAGQWRSVPFLRASSAYVAVIPAEEIDAPGLAYTIELQRTSGEARAVFASRAAPFTVEVLEERADVRERAAVERLLGRRSLATAGAEFASFGKTEGRYPIPCGANQVGCAPGTLVLPTVSDQYWKVEVGYTYRPLRTIAEFSLKGGVVRGQSLARSVSTYEVERYKVGLNYASPSVRFRLGDSWHLETSVLTSITEVGFSVGGGGALLIGDPYGSKLTLGFETIGIGQQYFGSRFYSRLDLTAGERIRISPMIEITDMPHADSFGVRLLTDATIEIARGFSVGVRAGYQARRSTSGGVALGTTLGLAF
jgi:hypothetical protein